MTEQELREKIVTILYEELEPLRPTHARDAADNLADDLIDLIEAGYVELSDVIEGKIEVLGCGTILDLRTVKRT